MVVLFCLRLHCDIRMSFLSRDSQRRQLKKKVKCLDLRVIWSLDVFINYVLKNECIGEREVEFTHYLLHSKLRTLFSFYKHATFLAEAERA